MRKQRRGAGQRIGPAAPDARRADADCGRHAARLAAFERLPEAVLIFPREEIDGGVPIDPAVAFGVGIDDVDGHLDCADSLDQRLRLVGFLHEGHVEADSARTGAGDGGDGLAEQLAIDRAGLLRRARDLIVIDHQRDVGIVVHLLCKLVAIGIVDGAFEVGSRPDQRRQERQRQRDCEQNRQAHQPLAVSLDPDVRP